MSQRGHAPYTSERWPYQFAVLPAPPDFVFLLPTYGDGLPATDTMVFRLNPASFAIQPYGSANRSFLSHARFANANCEGGQQHATLVVVDGLGQSLAEQELPLQMAPNEGVLATVPSGRDRMVWGCVGAGPEGQGEGPEPAPVGRFWAYRTTVGPGNAAAGSAEVWALPSGRSYLGAAPEAGLTETVQFLAPSLSESPERGLAVWRKRTISLEAEEATARIYELIHWTPEREKLVGLYAEYRGRDGERSWRFDDQGEWIERPYIRWPQIAEKLGIEPWPVCAISPDGKQILYTCACDLRVIDVLD